MAMRYDIYDGIEEGADTMNQTLTGRRRRFEISKGKTLSPEFVEFVNSNQARTPVAYIQYVLKRCQKDRLELGEEGRKSGSRNQKR